MPPCRLKKKSPSERKVSDGLYFQNQKPEKRVRACGTHPTHESKNHRTTVGCVAQATHAFGGWNGLCRLRWLNADSVRDVRDACVRLRRLWAACVPTALLWHTPYTRIKKPPHDGRVCGASHARVWRVEWVMQATLALSKQSVIVRMKLTTHPKPNKPSEQPSFRRLVRFSST